MRTEAHLLGGQLQEMMQPLRCILLFLLRHGFPSGICIQLQILSSASFLKMSVDAAQSPGRAALSMLQF